MRVLLDTHALLWWFFDDPRLPAAARRVMADPATTVYVSSASAWEIAIKQQAGKLVAGDLLDRFESYVAAAQMQALPITIAHGRAAGVLPGPHKDPFDRMIIAQAIAEDLTLISGDTAFRNYAVSTIWQRAPRSRT